MIALIDGDIVAYRCAASIEPTKIKPERELSELALARTEDLLYRILDSCQTTEYRIFLSGSENFRYLLFPDYKANRRNLPRPEMLDSCRELLVREWGAKVTAGYEADDGIGIAFTDDSIICSIDKDFRQIAGQHYNFVKDIHEIVDSEESTLAFWSSMLIGDRSDNLPGIDGIGPVKARKLLCDKSPTEMESCVREYYGESFTINYHLFRILRSEQEYVKMCETVLNQAP